eukprot:m.12344 g.12344  ORF g.12344 m.12344 type:complete len:137 (-) comp3988_c1_seq1:109-519(-)
MDAQAFRKMMHLLIMKTTLLETAVAGTTTIHHIHRGKGQYTCTCICVYVYISSTQTKKKTTPCGDNTNQSQSTTSLGCIVGQTIVADVLNNHDGLFHGCHYKHCLFSHPNKTQNKTQNETTPPKEANKLVQESRAW